MQGRLIAEKARELMQAGVREQVCAGEYVPQSEAPGDHGRGGRGSTGGEVPVPQGTSQVQFLVGLCGCAILNSGTQRAHQEVTQEC